MKKIAIVMLLLCGCATACHKREDTIRVVEWPREVEPRLTGATWQRCSGVECGPPGRIAAEVCPELIETHHDALRMLAAQPQCTDRAIEALQGFARRDARALSDIAAAYYLRAKRGGRESELLRALEAALRAVEAMPRDEAARFNLALVQETAGLSGDAIASWDALVAIDRSQWAEEARERLRRLRKPVVSGPWLVQRRKLRAALAAGDRAAVRTLIADFPTPALEELSRTKDPASAKLLDTELSLRLGGEEMRSLHHARGVQSARAHSLNRQSRNFESLSDYNAALEIFVHLRDADMIASTLRARVGIYRAMGQPELAWRESLQALPYAPRVGSTRRRQMVFTEAAETAAILGYARAALLYQDAALRTIQEDAKWISPEDAEEEADLRRFLASARRVRAGIEVRLGWLEDAENDLVEATRLMEKGGSETVALQARMQEVRGQTLLPLNPSGAADAFTSALNAVARDELKSFRASLYAQRAEARRRSGREADAARDLGEALRELREEESRILRDRERGEGENLWSAYFSRFDDTYERLIEQLGSGDGEKAFDYKERSLAYEPLNLILTLDVTPPSFRRLVPRGEPMTLAAIAAELPPGTALLQYAVLKNETHAWIIRRNRATHLAWKLSRAEVERFSELMQRAVRERDANLMHRTSKQVFEALIEKPLAAAGADMGRLVIVPDGAMHGLPFAALYDSKAKEYLIEKAPIELAGSATLYIFSLHRDDAFPPASPSALLIGDPAFDEESDLARGMERLPGALAEVEQIRRAYAPLMPVEVRTGADATFAAMLELARNRTVIHFAGHSMVNEEQPWRSVLLLARSGGDSGAVEAAELVRKLRLDRTRLFVLAACSSAGGLPVGPEGVAPLVRPLIAAGVPAVMGSLWDVEDATAEKLSVSFHRYYGKGSDAAAALQAAQRDMLRNENPGLRSVLAWAPFQVIGHASSPFAPSH
ncbi:MAG TPA: CHAT domain-containing protein [Thermoanaerobaculia bacterium]|nr:CHAT domain-containing protein [Thermoanaerobaculia bacterium]